MRAQRILSIAEGVDAWVRGFGEMIEPLVVLLLAWALGAVLDDLATADYIAQLFSDAGVSSAALPLLLTVFTMVLSYVTGSAMGSMGIMFPLALPLAHSLASDLPADEAEAVVMQCAAAILGGSAFGNTASPIGDTTVLAATAKKRGQLVSTDI